MASYKGGLGLFRGIKGGSVRRLGAEICSPARLPVIRSIAGLWVFVRESNVPKTTMERWMWVNRG
jgi:hypothetical protein